MKTGILLIISKFFAAALASLNPNLQVTPTGCPADERRFLEADFYSIGTGINEEALEVVLGTACDGACDGSVVQVSIGSRGGFEGERSVCIEYTSARAMQIGLTHIRVGLQNNEGVHPLPRLTSAHECTRLEYIPYHPIDACMAD